MITKEMLAAAAREINCYVGKYDLSESLAEAALTAALSSQWREMESAPKDGTKILAFGLAVPDYPAFAWDPSKPREPITTVVYWNEHWHDRDEEVSPELFKKVRELSWAGWWPHPHQFTPTHWIPLPPPPAQE